MLLGQKNQQNPQPTTASASPQERTNIESGEASAGGFVNAATPQADGDAGDDPGTPPLRTIGRATINLDVGGDIDTARPRVAVETSRDVGAPELAEQYQHAAPLLFPAAINDQVARSYGSGVTDGMRAGLLDFAELLERRAEELHRESFTMKRQTVGAVADELSTWVARLRAAVTL